MTVERRIILGIDDIVGLCFECLRCKAGQLFCRTTSKFGWNIQGLQRPVFQVALVWFSNRKRK